MDIQIVASIGAGATSLSSFDCALQNAGVSNYNLIALSSVIPPGSTVSVVQKYSTPDEDFGKRLYVVKAEQRSEKVGECIGAGIGWYQLEDGRGFFVEHEAQGQSIEMTKESLEALIYGTLADMCEFRGIQFQKENVNHLLRVNESKTKYACALVLAVYQSTEW